MQIRVYYEDTDAGGIVYHTNYIKYCERARSEHFFSRGMVPHGSGMSGFVVRNLTADYLSISKLGDLLTVKSTVKEYKKSSLILTQEIYNKDVKVFSMNIVLVYVEEARPARIPKEFIELFDSL